MTRAVDAIKRIIRTVTQPTPLHRAPRAPVPASMPLRPWVMPRDAQEAMAIQRRREWNNGRYYVVADVILHDGTFLRDVEFDGDTHVAVMIGRRPIWDFPTHLAKPIAEFFIVTDAESGSVRFEADEQRRAAFAARHAAGGRAAP